MANPDFRRAFTGMYGEFTTIDALTGETSNPPTPHLGIDLASGEDHTAQALAYAFSTLSTTEEPTAPSTDTASSEAPKDKVKRVRVRRGSVASAEKKKEPALTPAIAEVRADVPPGAGLTRGISAIQEAIQTVQLRMDASTEAMRSFSGAVTGRSLSARASYVLRGEVRIHVDYDMRTREVVIIGEYRENGRPPTSVSVRRPEFRDMDSPLIRSTIENMARELIETLLLDVFAQQLQEYAVQELTNGMARGRRV